MLKRAAIWVQQGIPDNGASMTFRYPPPLVLFSFVLPTYIDFSQLLLEEVQKPLGPGLSNTADRLKKLNKSKEEDQVFCWRKNHRVI